MSPPSPPRPPFSRAAARCALCLAVLLGGCASWKSHGVVPTPEGQYRIALLPVRMTARVGHLADLEAVPPPAPAGPAERDRIDAALAEAGERMTREMAARLSDAPPLVLVPLESLAPADPAAFARAADADAALEVKVSGYGKIKRRWVAFLIGSGVVEGIVQGVIAERVLHNTWVAVGVALEEIGSEVLTWGGGSWLFDAAYAPVTLEARLVAARDGRTVWHDLVFVGIDRKALKALPTEARKRREVQLKVTAEKAERELVRDLQKAARLRLAPPPKPRGRR